MHVLCVKCWRVTLSYTENIISQKVKIYVHTKTRKQMFISALYRIAKNMQTIQVSINW